MKQRTEYGCLAKMITSISYMCLLIDELKSLELILLKMFTE